MTFEEQNAIPLSHISGITKSGKNVWWNVREPDAFAFFKNTCLQSDNLNYLQLTTETGKVTARWAHEIGADISDEA